MEVLFRSGDIDIAGHLARPPAAPGTLVPGVVICHGFPTVRHGAALAARSFPELADRIATEMGWAVLVFTLRGCGASGGDFSLQGWLDDLLAATRWTLALDQVRDVYVAGFGTGGALSICAAAHEERIRGVAALGAPADFDDWASQPRRLVQHSRDVGIIRAASGFPPSLDAWAREFKDLRAVACAPEVAGRPLLLVHGSDDDLVPVFDARVLADAHGQGDLRIIEGAGHELRHDPRAVAVLLGWLDRQRNQRAAQARPLP